MRNTPAPNLPASTPYLATSTLYQNPPLSTNNLQHHLPNKAKLNSLNYLTPKPPYSFCKQIELQAIHEIFLLSSLPPQKNLIKIDSMREIIPGGALKKERA